MNKKDFFENVNKICNEIIYFSIDSNIEEISKLIDFDYMDYINNKKVLFEELKSFCKKKECYTTNELKDLIIQLSLFKTYCLNKDKAKLHNIVYEQMSITQNILANKSIEYETENNAFNNLEIGAKLTGLSIQDVCFGYMLKHLVSVYEILTTDRKFSNKIIEEKFNDLINYLIIFEIINTKIY